MLDEIVGVASSGGLGAIVGLIGGTINRFQQYKMRKIELQSEEKMRGYDIAEAKLERQHDLDMADKQVELAETEAEIAYEQQDLANLGESIKLATKSSGNSKVDALKGSMRPLITIFLLLMTCALLYALWDKVGGLGVFEELEAITLFKHIVTQMVFLTVTAVSWWFASRPARLDKK